MKGRPPKGDPRPAPPRGGPEHDRPPQGGPRHREPPPGGPTHRRPPGGGPQPRLLADDLLAGGESSLLDLVDHLLDQGAVVTGDVVLGLAGVDLVYLRLSLLLAAADRVLGPSDDAERASSGVDAPDAAPTASDSSRVDRG